MKKALLIASLALAAPGYASFVEEAQEINGHYRTLLTKKEYMKYDMDIFKSECKFVFQFIEYYKKDGENMPYLRIVLPLPDNYNELNCRYSHKFFESPLGPEAKYIALLVQKVMKRRFPTFKEDDIQDINEFEKVATKLFNEKGEAMKKQLSEFKE